MGVTGAGGTGTVGGDRVVVVVGTVGSGTVGGTGCDIGVTGTCAVVVVVELEGLFGAVEVVLEVVGIVVLVVELVVEGGLWDVVEDPDVAWPVTAGVPASMEPTLPHAKSPLSTRVTIIARKILELLDFIVMHQPIL